MPDETKFAVYFSHSWRPHDVDLNLLVWSEVCKSCELLVDAPDEAGANPPYYINRIEELLRRSDLFVCVLTHRVENDPSGQGPDAALQCSKYSVFEIRLAERMNIPRLILYERSTGFKATRSPRSNELYVAFDRGRQDPLPELRHWKSTISSKIQQWVSWAMAHRRPVSYEQPSLAVNLMKRDIPDSAEVGEVIETAIKRAGYERVSWSTPFQNNIESAQILHAAGLVVGEFGVTSPVSSELYTAAHTLGLPAIRMVRGGADPAKALPWFLRDHPGGYSQDLVSWTKPEELAAQIEPRARAMFRICRALGDDDTRQYLNSKRYSQSFVFISHTLKPPHRELVEKIYASLEQRYVKPFEYHLVNPAGEEWKKALDEQLRKTTHFVVLLTDGYETSPVCTYEMDEVLKRGSEVKILPFMAAGRSTPHPRLGQLHHRLLSATDLTASAKVVADRVMNVLAGKSEDVEGV